jgi:acetyl-CoA carboxylase carboxyl transferase subunit alpha
MEYLDFEKPIADLNNKIEALRNIEGDNAAEISNEIKSLELKSNKLLKNIFNNLTDWQIIKLARHPNRPYSMDYINSVFEDFEELHGDRAFADDKAVIGGLAKLDGRPVMVIGQQKGRTTKEKLEHNFGMMHPEGYRKALRLMKLAEKFGIPIVTLIDTPGAYPGVQAEERGQSEAIAVNLREMSQITVPIICVVIGEGCSGGAVGIGVGDRFLMMEYSYFATISPEGCASILWKTADKAADAAEIMGITARKLLKIGVIDKVIKEPFGGAHRDVNAAANIIKSSITSELDGLLEVSVAELLEKRYHKITSYGEYDIL